MVTQNLAQDTDLIVPVRLRALLVNDKVKQDNAFHRWLPNFRLMEHGESAEPPPGENLDPEFGRPGSTSSLGVHLHWEVPAALRRGRHVPHTDRLDFPLVPNRWLVVRWHSEGYGGQKVWRGPTCTVVRSDFTDPRTGTTPYYTERQTITRVGTRLPVSPESPWSEPGSPDMFLTALGPGLPGFTTFQPYCRDVFSMQDTLSGLLDTPTDLHYLVLGWYSDATKDPLHGATGDQLSALLQERGWVPDQPPGGPVRTVFAGHVQGLRWSRTGDPQRDPVPVEGTVKVAVGSTGIDAFTALAGAVTHDDRDLADLPVQLSALQYGLLDQMSAPDAVERLDQYSHLASFAPVPGGHHWEHTDTVKEAPPAAELAVADRLVADLNRKQAAYEEGERALQSAQRRLYTLWRTAHLTQRPSGYTDQRFDEQLDPAHADGLAARVERLRREVDQARAALPTIPPDATDDQVAAEAAKYTSAQGERLPTRFRGRRRQRPPYFRANDPVVLMSGTGAHDPTDTDRALPCRTPDRIVSDLKVDGNPLLGSDANLTKLKELTGTTRSLGDSVPASLPALAAESWLFDPAGAAQLAQAFGADAGKLAEAQRAISGDTVTGRLPEFGVTPWSQAWSPLYLEWTATYSPIPYSPGQSWEFDGRHYRWNGTSPDPKPTPFTVRGRTPLSDQAGFNLRARLRQHADHRGPDEEELIRRLAAFVELSEGWGMITQNLDGLTSRLFGYDPARALRPPEADPVRPLVGLSFHDAPDPGRLPDRFSGAWPPSNVQEVRGGQLRITGLSLVDGFGRVSQVIARGSGGPAADVPVSVAEDLAATKSVEPGVDPTEVAQLAPRLPQHARLRMDFVDTRDDTRVIEENADTDPVVAWVVNNHLDPSVQCYLPSGDLLGEIRTLVGDDGRPFAEWRDLPGTPPGGLDLVPKLRSLYEGLGNSAERFSDLRETIHHALEAVAGETAQDDTDFSVITGRPLALVRLRVLMSLDGTPIADPSWRYTFDFTRDRDYHGYTWPVRLGDRSRLSDGLIGYFTGDDYATLNGVITPPRPASDYVRPIGTGSGLRLPTTGTPTYLTALVDPRSPIHAATGILPIVQLALPKRAYTGPLAALPTSLHTGPLLTTTRAVGKSRATAGSGPGTPAVVVPVSGQRKGVWRWHERDRPDPGTPEQPGPWHGPQPTVPVDPDATFPVEAPRMRSGVLIFTPNEAARPGTATHGSSGSSERRATGPTTEETTNGS